MGRRASGAGVAGVLMSAGAIMAPAHFAPHCSKAATQECDNPAFARSVQWSALLARPG